jgi:phage shock protein A
MQAKLKDAQRRLGTLTARKRAADARARMAAAQSCFHPRVDTGAFDKFDRLTRKVEMAEAEAEALSELARRERTVEDTMFPGDNERGDLEIEAELEELKRKQAIQ